MPNWPTGNQAHYFRKHIIMDDRHTFTILVRSPWGSELDLGGVSINTGAPVAETKAAIAASLSAIATELIQTAWEGPTEPTPWLDTIDLLEFTDTINRDHAFLPQAGLCAALPARAFRGRYPFGCVADKGHSGNHTTNAAIAERARRRDALQGKTTPNW